MSALRKVSQSFIKEFTKYLYDETCGIQLVAKYYDDIQFPSSKAMRLGQYFEWKATGQLPKYGDTPEPDMIAKGTKLSTDFQRAQDNAEYFKTVIEELGIKIIDTGLKLENDTMTGEIDIYAEWNGEKVFIDTKYSSLIDDKWSPFGWEKESLPEKDGLMIQGVQYKMLAKDCLGIDDIPFYYFVFSTKEVGYAKIYKQNVDEGRFLQHELAVQKIRNKLKSVDITWFKPKPDLKRCMECPLAENCNFKVTTPIVEEIFY